MITPAKVLWLLTAVVVAVGCTSAHSPAPRKASPSSSAGARIPQPPLPSGVPVAPDSARVDLLVPEFSHPTRITNPLFPVSEQASVVFVGHVDGKPFRTEVTLLPFTRVIAWGGQQIETAVSQYTAYLGGRLQEVAYDLYAQADDRSVWYFGEDVADLANGVIASKEGTWLAGKDGPAQMIMPGHPADGDVFRTENIPGVAFEQVTVKRARTQLRGPLGPVEGMIGQELHEDGSTEFKQFADGYGEFYTSDAGDVEALALALPTDEADGSMPAGLSRMFEAADEVLRHGPSTRSIRTMRRAWATVPRGDVPRLMAPVGDRALREVAAAGTRQQARQAAMDVALRTLDLELRWRSPTEVNRDRVRLWCDQLLLDVDAHDAGQVRSDVFTLFYLRDRIQPSLSAPERSAYNHELGVLQVAAFDRNLRQAARAAAAMRAALRPPTG